MKGLAGALRHLLAIVCILLGLLFLVAAIATMEELDVFVLALVLAATELGAGIMLLCDNAALLEAKAQAQATAALAVPAELPQDADDLEAGDSGEESVEEVVTVTPLIPLPGDEPQAADPAAGQTEPEAPDHMAPAAIPEAQPVPAAAQPVPAAAQPVPAPAEAPATPAPQSKRARPARRDMRATADELVRLVRGTGDLYATLKDLVKREQGHPTKSAQHYAAVLLERTGLMTWEDAPAVGALVLGRTGRFWTIGSDDHDDTTHDLALSCELALNLARELAHQGQQLETEQEIVKAARKELMAALKHPGSVSRWDPAPEDLLAYPDGRPFYLSREWHLRRIISHWAEHMRAHLRLAWRMSADARLGMVCISVEGPGPDVFAVVEDEAETRGSIATEHAIEIAFDFLTAALFITPDKLANEVVVNVHERRSSLTLLSMHATQDTLAELMISDMSAPVVSTDMARMRRGMDGWLEPVEPFMDLDDKPVGGGPRYERAPELEDFIAPDGLEKAANVKRVSELGIDEDAARISAFQRVLPHAQGSTQELVAALVELRDEPGADPTVTEAAERVMGMLVSGELDAGDEAGLQMAFVHGSALERDLLKAGMLWEQGKDPDRVLGLVKAQLAPIMAAGTYQDTDEEVWRYFESYSSRVQFNRYEGEERRVRLVPDAYYGAHLLAGNVLLSLDRADEAEAHAQELLRLSPNSTDPYLMLSRVRQAQGRTQEAEELARESLEHVLTPQDVALALYRLGFMEWLLGEHDLGAAAYVVSISLGGPMQMDAESELDEMLSSTGGERPTIDAANKLLKDDGLRVAPDEELVNSLLATAIVCCDMGLFRPARMLLASVLRNHPNDEYVNVVRSLMPTSEG